METAITVVKLNQMNLNDVIHSDLDDTTYILKTTDGFSVCDNGEEVAVTTAADALRIVNENANANAS